MLRTDGDPELRVFDPVIRFLHWLTLFLIVTIFVLAFSIDFASSKEEAVALIQLHRSFGVAVWVVTLGRLVWRQFARFPNWPADMPQAMRFAAQWSEYALYALLLTQPIPGLPAHQRAWRPGEPVLPRPAAGADRPGPPAREAASGGAHDGRARSPPA
jgi:cytochrome b561